MTAVEDRQGNCHFGLLAIKNQECKCNASLDIGDLEFYSFAFVFYSCIVSMFYCCNCKAVMNNEPRIINMGCTLFFFLGFLTRVSFT